MMLFTPRQTGNISIPKDELKEDKQNCLRIGPCGIGKKAIYLNSFFLDRVYYVDIRDVRRVFKRVAMTKNGFTGRGMFGAMSYLVVVLSNGREQQCNFKYEQDVDKFISEFHARWPKIPTVSANAEKRLARAKAEEENKYVKNLSEKASHAISELDKATEYLEGDPSVYDKLCQAASAKRIVDNIKPGYQILAALIIISASVAIIYGVYLLIRGDTTLAAYLLLFGAAFIFFALSMQVLPSRRNNKKAAKLQLDRAVAESEQYIRYYLPVDMDASGEGSTTAGSLTVETTGKKNPFPVPPQYAHPYVLKRMKRIILKGQAETAGDAYRLMKEELKALNSTVRVSKEEHDEVVAIKPVFLACDYEDEYRYEGT